jgi:hypothetical protein
MSGPAPQPYAVTKRDRKREVAKPRPDGRAVVFICKEVLKEIWIHADEVRLTGIITFVTLTGKEIRRLLFCTWFPQGIWKLKFEKGDVPGGFTATPVGAQNVDPVILNRLMQMTGDREFQLYTFVVEGDLFYDPWTDALHKSAIGREITVHVTYKYFDETGDKGQQIRDVPLSDEYLFEALADEIVARIFLVMLQHFAGIAIDERIALGGIDRKEYAEIVKIPSKDKNLDPRTIARVVTRAAHEYTLAGGDSWESLIFLIETLLYQRKCKNAWAVANQLEIGKGLLRLPGGAFIEDLGIKMRGKSALLLYDRFGNAVPAYIGYMDINYRNVDLDKVPHIEIKIDDPGMAHFIKVLEQTFAFPTRETYVFCSNTMEFYQFIVAEIKRLYDDDIQKKIMIMLPWAIGFFVVHAVVGAMASRGNVYAAAILVLAKAIGWIMGVDMGLAMMKKMNLAGSHFVKMETIHRRTPQEKGKEKLSELSKFHLEKGTLALIDAMSDAFALGFFVAAGKLGQKASGTIGKYLCANRNDARLEIHLEGDALVKVRTRQGKTSVEVQIQEQQVKSTEAAESGGPGQESVKSKAGGEGGGGKTPATGKGTAAVEVRTQKPPVERTTSTGVKLKLVDSPPLEEAARNLGSRQQSVRPQPGTVVDLLKMKYSTTDPAGRPASSEAVSGIPEKYMQTARDIVAQGPGGGKKVMVLFRVTNPRGVQHILKGNPPKGKDLIELNTSKETGKVTIKTVKQRVVAWMKGHYVLAKDGFAYDDAGRKLSLKSGEPVKFDMKERGQFGELTNQAGQVIDKVTRKAFVGDFDVQDVIDISAPGRNVAGVPESMKGDVTNPLVNWFKNAFNSKLKESGDMPRVVHGADAQFMQFKTYRQNAFKGDSIGILPDGRVVSLTEANVGSFYQKIGRSRLELPQGTKLEPYKKE